MKKLKITNKTKVNRLPNRAAYDNDTIYNILDDTFICQVGFKIDGQVYIIPTVYGRKEDYIFIHGSKNSRMLSSIKIGEDVCISVTLADGLVLARSAFHHSINYRSVIIFGKGREIIEPDKKTEALKIILDHIIPGRWDDVRKPNQKELNATSVMSFKIDEASAKIRNGPSVDDKEDLNLNVWTGVLPLEIISGKPIKDEGVNNEILLPPYIINYKRKKGNHVD